jgi:hypothetical protein
MDVSFDEAEADLNNLQQLFKENKADSLVACSQAVVRQRLRGKACDLY